MGDESTYRIGSLKMENKTAFSTERAEQLKKIGFQFTMKKTDIATNSIQVQVRI